MMNYVLSPSILAADFKVLGQEMKKTEENGAAYIHFDVMDGMFVPSISFGMPVLASIHDATEQFMDAHLMVQEPIRYVEAFQKAGRRRNLCGECQRSIGCRRKCNCGRFCCVQRRCRGKYCKIHGDIEKL